MRSDWVAADRRQRDNEGNQTPMFALRLAMARPYVARSAPIYRAFRIPKINNLNESHFKIKYLSVSDDFDEIFC